MLLRKYLNIHYTRIKYREVKIRRWAADHQV
jgi:hypothetical protein